MSIDVEQLLQTISKQIEQAMDLYLPKEGTHPSILYEAMRYSVFAGGKRLRPALLLLTTKACRGSQSDALRAACGLEFIHTYSLIHDDLPAMDNDDFRRGRPTNHKVFGEANAILAGDALLTHAFSVLSSGDLAAEIKVRLIQEVAQASGALGMVAGQAADLLAENSVIDVEQLAFIHQHKTGDLLRASVRMGAIVAGVTEDTLDALTKYAEALGLAFQIHDDILDVVGDPVALGKQTGMDESLQKATWPSLHGLEASRQQVSNLTDYALSCLESLEPREAFAELRALATWLVHRNH